MKIKMKIRNIGVVTSRQCIIAQPYDLAMLDEIEKFKGRDDVYLKVETEGKSRNINAYMWALCRQISEHPDVKMSDVEVYQDAVLNAGCNNWFDGEVKAEDFQRFCRSFTRDQVGWFVAHYAETKNGTIQYRAYYGSSIFDSDQMNRLVDYVVRQAESYRIPTLETEKLERMISQWGADG